jgi:cobalamin biosynthesis protein CobT
MTSETTKKKSTKKKTTTTKKIDQPKKEEKVEEVVEEKFTRKKIAKSVKEKDLKLLLEDYVYEYYDIDLASGERLSKTEKAELASVVYNSLKFVVDMK